MRAIRNRTRRRRRAELGRDVVLGAGVRLDAAPGARIAIGDGARLAAGCRIEAEAGEVVIGAGARLGERCVIVALERVHVGDGAVLGDGVLLADAGPVYSDADRPVREQGVRTAPVHVGARAVLGHGACVLPGVTVGEDAQVLAHAVVRRDLAPGTRLLEYPVPAPSAPTSRRSGSR